MGQTERPQSPSNSAPEPHISGPRPIRRTRSLLRYAPAVVLLAAAIADMVRFAGTDLWLHIEFGQFVLRTHHLLRHDIFSYSAPGAPWFNHEWMADVLMASAYRALGVLGLKLFKFACACAVFALLAAATAETGAALGVQIATLFAAALGLAIQMQFRPQLFDYIFLAALLALLNRDARGRSAPLWLAIPIMALWANLHGGFLLGLGVLGVYAAVRAAQDLVAGRGWRRTLRLGLLILVASAVTVINPFGIQEWRVALTKFREPVIATSLNMEFRSLPRVLASGSRSASLALFSLPALIVLGGIISFVAAPSTEDLPLVAIAMMMTCGWIYAVRNTALAVIAWSAPLAFHLDLVMARRRSLPAASRQDRRSAPLPGQLALAAAAILLCAGSGLFSNELMAYRQYPVGAIAFMQRRGLHGNVMAEYGWGGYVIWHEVPPSRVFFDSFDERYPAAVQNAYMDFLIGGPRRASAMLKAYPHEFVLMPAGSEWDRFMASRKDWVLLYRDPAAVLYARSESAAARLTAIPEIQALAPPSTFP